jgi:CubicO group peptidase (beta-lactamase class C family)
MQRTGVVMGSISRSHSLLGALLAALASAAAPCWSQDVKPESVGFSSAGLHSIDSVVDRHIAAGDIPGAVILVQRRGKTVLWEARGGIDTDRSVPLTRDTVFWVASLTKPIVAASLLMLLDEGKVSLDDPVWKYIPEFRHPRQVRTLKTDSPPQYDLAPAQRDITLKDLLDHTSGIQAIGVENSSIPPITNADTTASWVPKLADSILEFQPGSRWAYSNAAGFDVLVRVIEVASGQPFNIFVQHRLFDPLRMTSSGFRGQRPDLLARLMPLDAKLLANPCVAGVIYFCGSAGLWMSADDYARFAQMLLDGGTAPNGKRLLKARTIALMASNQADGLFKGTQGISGSGAGMGLGVLVITDQALSGTTVPNGSFGWDGVGSRRFWVMPSENTVLVMFIPSGKATQVHRDVEAAVMAARLH